MAHCQLHPDDLGTLRLPLATTVDAFVAWPLTGKLQLIARGENLLDEAVIAGQSYTQYTYERPNHVTAIVFVHSLRDALFALGWKLIDVTRLEEIPIQPETVNVAAHYRNDGRNVYVRATQEPGEPYRVNVADVGKED